MPLTDFEQQMLAQRLPLQVTRIYMKKYCEKYKIEPEQMDIDFSNHPETKREEYIEQRMKVKAIKKAMTPITEEKIDDNEIMIDDEKTVS